MAADVSSLVRLLNRYKDDRNGATGPGPVALMTRDLLGSGGRNDQSLELDLDLQVPNGWEKRLDLKSGKVYLQQCNSTSSTRPHRAETIPRFQDLNFPPVSGKPPAKPLLSLFDDTSLDLKLVPSTTPLSRQPPSSSSSPSTSSYLSVSPTKPSFQSVCTLDKVKSALERAEKDPSSSGMIKKRQSPEGGVCDRTASSSPVAAGCPGCLSYVLVLKNNPKCPRCLSLIPLPPMKKPKFDLNISI